MKGRINFYRVNDFIITNDSDEYQDIGMMMKERRQPYVLMVGCPLVI